MSRRHKRLRNLAAIHGQLQVMAERRLAETRGAREQALAAIRDVETLSGYNPALDDLLRVNAAKTLVKLRRQADQLALECVVRQTKVLNHFVRCNLVSKLSVRIAKAAAKQNLAREAASVGLASLPQEIVD